MPKLSLNQHWWSQEIAGARMLNARFKEHLFPPHTHESFTVALVTGGSYLVRAAAKVFVAKPGAVIFLNPGEVHSGAPGERGGWTMRSMHLNADSVREYIMKEFEQANFRFTRQLWARDQILANYFYRLHRSAETNRRSKEACSLYHQLMGHFVKFYSEFDGRSAAEKDAFTGITSKAKLFMRDNLGAKLLLDDIASQTGLSKFYFLKIFGETEGITPHAWLTQQRIERSADILRTNCDARLSDVAVKVGFSDQAHFTREFKKIIGLTPRIFQTNRAEF